MTKVLHTQYRKNCYKQKTQKVGKINKVGFYNGVASRHIGPTQRESRSVGTRHPSVGLAGEKATIA